MGKATHLHNWEKFSGDASGIIIGCTGCDEVVFLPDEEAKKFEQAYATQTSVEIELINPVNHGHSFSK